MGVSKTKKILLGDFSHLLAVYHQAPNSCSCFIIYYEAFEDTDLIGFR